MPDLTAEHRTALYASVNEVVDKLHQIDPVSVGLQHFRKSSQTRPIEAMEALIEWLPRHLPKDSPNVLFHGDLRLDNLVFHSTEARVMAVLDWELSTLGDPVLDSAHQSKSRRIPASLFPGLGGLDLAALGNRDEDTYLSQYDDHTGFEHLETWRYHLALSLFRLAAIVHGVAARAR